MKKQLSGMALALSLAAQSVFAASVPVSGVTPQTDPIPSVPSYIPTPGEKEVPLPPSPVKDTVPETFNPTTFGVRFTGIGTYKPDSPVKTYELPDGRYILRGDYQKDVALECGETLDDAMQGYYELENRTGAGVKRLWRIDNYVVFSQTFDEGFGSSIQTEIVVDNKVVAAAEIDRTDTSNGDLPPFPIAPFVAPEVLASLDGQIQESCRKLWHDNYVVNPKTSQPDSLANMLDAASFDPAEEASVVATRRAQVQAIIGATTVGGVKPAP